MALDEETLSQFLDTLGKFVDRRLRPLESQVGTEDKILYMLDANDFTIIGQIETQNYIFTI